MRNTQITANDLDSNLSKSRVRQNNGKLKSQIYIRVPDSVIDMIIEIQEKEPGFKYSTYLRPIVVKAIRKKYMEVIKGESKNE